AYHNPGDLIDNEQWLPGFRFYVLGPPRDKTILGDLGEHGSNELYGLTRGLRMAAESIGGAESAEIRDELPFDQRFYERDEAKQQSWYPAYFAETEEWRTIEHEWLNSASDLALQLDSMTNNTSLALAIERTADGKVLLFPADAQQGNWLSWHAPEIKWRIADPSGVTREVTAADLLQRTVFYKVGHHSSHNATARAKGLELMREENGITAFIPVDRAVALTRNPKDSWQMPARPLYRRLLEKCGGRVARSDIGWVIDPTGVAATKTEKEFVGMAAPAEWSAWKTAQKSAQDAKLVNFDQDAFIEYLLD
ncbi:MAG TPA: hypothetical protein VMR25_07620, partial [Planctomycetaceae bacterium]|nr:hypothetical protein [Planctomycetaceae bacterium]